MVTLAERAAAARAAKEARRQISRQIIAERRSRQVTQVAPGVFRTRDPNTGRLVVTSSRSFAESVSSVGKSRAIEISKAQERIQRSKIFAQQKKVFEQKKIAEQKIREATTKAQRIKALSQAQLIKIKTKQINKRIQEQDRLLTLREVRAMAEIQPAPKASFIQRQERERERLRTKKQRGQKLTLEEEAILAGRTFIQSVSEFGVAVVALPKTLVNLAKNPSQLKDIPSSISKEGLKFGQLLRTSPTEAFVKVGTEILLLKASGKGFNAVGKVGNKATTKLSPKFKGLKKGAITIPSTTKGQTIKIKVGGTVKKISTPLPKQVALAGKRTTAVSAQADRLVNFLKGKRIVRKPIPGEATLSKTTKALLKKFDDGKITTKQFTLLDDAIRKETRGAGNLLERSFFADPKGRFRPSRLGIGKQKEASLLDILSGDITFKSSKPQILVFENVKVAKFPKALRDIQTALRTGKTLTKSQSKRLLAWQSKKTGKFKPIGALSKEPEITLAPGEVIKKVKKVGVTLIDGKKIEIVQAKVVKASKTTAKLLKKSKKGKLTAKELKTLNKKLTKETGFKSTLSRSTKLKPRARILKIVPRARAVTKVKRARRFIKGSAEARRAMRKVREARRVTTDRVIRRDARPPRVPTRIPPRRPPKRPPVRPPVRPPARPPLIKKISKPIRKKKPKKQQQVFNVFGKSRGKFVKLNVKPLVRGDALSKGAFAIDRTTARTFKITPAGKIKTPGKLLKGERNYFNRQGFKLREVRIKRGRKFQLKQKYIEKTKHAIDTKSEKSGLTIAKLIKQQKKSRKKRGSKVSTKKRSVVRIAPVASKRRKQLLKNLEKARRVRMKNLKGGKKK